MQETIIGGNMTGSHTDGDGVEDDRDMRIWSLEAQAQGLRTTIEVRDLYLMDA